MRTLRPHAPALLAAALVTLASWPITQVVWPVAGDFQPKLDLDGAWEIALRQALHDGLHFGPDVVFTYGPLGFLREPLLVYPWSARLAFVWGLLVQFALAATLIWGLRRAFGSLLVAALVAVPLAAAIWQEPTIVIGFTAALALAAGRARGRPAQALALGLGALTGIELLSKLNTGITLAVLAAIALLVAPAPRRALLAPCAGAALAALVVGWLATGQPLGGIDDYVRGSFEIISGYSGAMPFQDPLTTWERTVAILLTGVGFAVAWRAGDGLPRRARLGIIALWAVLAFTTFKAGFVRHDPIHANIFFASLLGGLVAFGWVPHRRQTAWLLGALFAVTLVGSLRADPRDFIRPVHRAGKLVDEARLLANPGDTRKAIAAARAARTGFEALDPRIVRAIGDRTVHVEPIDTGLVWAQGLRWHPLPVFQSYSAYTADLDDRNADAVRDPDGPEVILREAVGTFDNRNPAFESPAAMRAILCHFHARGGPLGRWILLERSAPRCGRERPLATVKAKLGVPAPVPAAPDANSAVFVRIDGIEVKGLEKVRTTLYRALQRQIAFDGGRSYRLVPGTARNGIVLRVPKGADFPAPFALDQATNTITVTKSGRRGDLTLRFFSMPVRP
jgi:hypothetical protein